MCASVTISQLCNFKRSYMASLNPYLNFNGNCEEAFNFYRSVFGGEFQMVMRFSDVPASEPNMGDGNKIMHISLPVGNDILMGSDVPESFGKVESASNFNISISADSKEEADRLYNGLSNGGNGYMPMADAFWGSYFGMLTDKFGVNWMIGYDQAPQG